MKLCESKDIAELYMFCSWKRVKDIPVLYWSCHCPNIKLGNNQYNEFLRINHLSEELSCSFLIASADFPSNLHFFSFELFFGWKYFLGKTRVLKKSNCTVAAAETLEPSTNIFTGWRSSQAIGILKLLLSTLNHPASRTAPCTPSLQFLAWGAGFLGLLE